MHSSVGRDLASRRRPDARSGPTRTEWFPYVTDALPPTRNRDCIALPAAVCSAPHNMTAHPSRLTLANRITIARILFIPVFILLTLYYMASVRTGDPNELLRWASLMVFVVTCLTDALDGYFARVRNERTRLGTLLDPLADKLLLLSSLILLTGSWGGNAFQPHLPPWYVLLVISRDTLLIIGAVVIHVAVGHTDVRPRIVGKMATFFQMGLIVWVLASGPAGWFTWVLGLAAGCTLASAALYVLDGVRQLEKAHVLDKHPHV